ncbi:MAG TPA: exodeoxyribonuclease VII small subunit, partial [Ignavibacteria bacterium]|nr:exodeoxyribonuclease VII small subunit [Ignavibacteria bacterium]
KDSFEFAYRKLEKILDELEQNIEEKSLDEIIENYQEGLKLLKLCRDKLSEAELKIEKIKLEK